MYGWCSVLKRLPLEILGSFCSLISAVWPVSNSMLCYCYYSTVEVKVFLFHPLNDYVCVMSSVLCFLVLFHSSNGWNHYSSPDKSESKRARVSSSLCVLHILHSLIMSGFVNELCALLFLSFSYIWSWLHFKPTRSATVLVIRILTIRL